MLIICKSTSRKHTSSSYRMRFKSEAPTSQATSHPLVRVWRIFTIVATLSFTCKGFGSRGYITVISQLFPDFDFNLFSIGMCVDILIGSDYCGLHPRKELVQAGEYLFLLEGSLGLCLQGTHPKLLPGGKIFTQMACAVITHNS